MKTRGVEGIVCGEAGVIDEYVGGRCLKFDISLKVLE